MSAEQGKGAAGIDLDEVKRLVDALERDLGKVGGDSSGVETLRNEVDQLRSALGSAEPPHQEVHSGLENVRNLLHRAGDELVDDAVKVGEYVTWIGRMLGM